MKRIIDIHAHLWLNDHANDERRLLQAAARYNISHIYVSVLDGFRPDEETVHTMNRCVADLVRRNSDCFSGYVYVSPEHKNALSVLRRGIEEQGLNGLKLWVSTFCDEPCVFPLIEYCEKHGLPILLHSFKKSNRQVASESSGRNVAALAYRYPNAKIIMAHLGGNCYDGIPAIRDYKNVWVDFCGSMFRGDELNYAVEQLGVQRILFGSDMPGSFVVNLGQVQEADLSAEEQEMILYLNAQKLFNPRFRL